MYYLSNMFFEHTEFDSTRQNITYMCVYIDVSIYVCIYIYMHMCKCVCIPIYSYIYVSRYVYIGRGGEIGNTSFSGWFLTWL